jgi:hypothetical protein
VNFMIWFRANWERAVGWTLLGVGALALIVGTLGVAQAKYVVDQLSFLMSGGLLGLGCVAFGGALLLTATLHDEWRKLDGIEGALRDGQTVPANASPVWVPREVPMHLAANGGSFGRLETRGA